MSNFKYKICGQMEIVFTAALISGDIYVNTFPTNLLIRLVIVNYIIVMTSNRHHSVLTFLLYMYIFISVTVTFI